MTEEIESYILSHSDEEGSLLATLNRDANVNLLRPRMISGHLQGRILKMFCRMLQPRRVLEIGTYTGYATLCMAEGLAENGKLTTLDINEDLEYIPRKYFAESAYSSQIDFRIENALDFLKETKEVFDFVFIDADKENYVEYFELLKPKMESGSLLLFDNVLWYRKVLEDKPDLLSTQKIQELNDTLAKDASFENVILPLRDGLSILRKK